MSAQGENGTSTSTFAVTPFEIAVGAVAAVVAAVASSFLGVGGTVTGAALASVVTPVSAAVVRRSAQRTNASVVRTNERLRVALRRGAGGAESTHADTGARIAGPADPEPADPDRRPLWTRKRMIALGAASLIAFVVALLAVTGLESAIGKPLSALLGNNSDRGTTLGQVVGGDQTSGRQDGPATTTAPAATTSTAPSPSPTDSPTGSASASPTAVSPSPTAAPSPTATGQATPTPPAGTASRTP
jgi:hypothetical protein